MWIVILHCRMVIVTCDVMAVRLFFRLFFFFQAEDGIRDLVRSRGLGDVYKRQVFAFGQNFMSQALSENIAFDLRNDLFAKIQRLSFSYHDRNRTGQLMIRATDDVERLRVFIGQGLLMALQALILLGGTLIILMLTNARLTLVVLPILPLALLIFMGFGAIAQPLFVEVQKRLGRVNTTLQENLAGLKVVKSFTSEAREEKRFHDSIDSLLEQRVKVNRIFSFLFPFIFLIANLGQAAVLYFGGRQIIGGTLTLGEWQKFSLHLIYVFIPMGLSLIHIPQPTRPY